MHFEARYVHQSAGWDGQENKVKSSSGKAKIMCFDVSPVTCFFDRHHLAGLVCNHILLRERLHYGLVSDLALALLKFAIEPRPSLKTLCHFASSARTVISGAQRLEGLPAWVRELRLASDRFEIALTEFGRKLWAERIQREGCDPLLSEMEKDAVELNPGLDKALRVIQQSKTMSNLSSDPAADSDVLQHIKSLITLDSLEIEEIKFFFPDCVEKMLSFQATVTKLALEKLDEVETHVKTGRDLIGKYRPGFRQTYPWRTFARNMFSDVQRMFSPAWHFLFAV